MRIFDKNEIISYEAMVKILTRTENKSKSEIVKILEEQGLKYFTNQPYIHRFGNYYFDIDKAREKK